MSLTLTNGIGPFEVVATDGAALVVRGAQRRLLLAMLVLHRNALCSTEQLIDVLFRDNPTPTAAGTVQSYVSRLRLDLGDDGERLHTRAGGYTLTIDDDELDSVAFEHRVGEALALVDSDPARAVGLLAESLSWWGGGRVFSEFGDDSALQAEATRLEEIRQQAAEALVDGRITLGDHAGAIDVLETCVAAWPLREAFRSQQMLVLHRCGRQPEALRAFRRYRDEIAEFGLVPSPSLADLEARILRYDPSLAARTATPGQVIGRSVTVTQPRATGNLPSSTSRLLGRDVELTELLVLLGATRLLTLTGPGGVGKTRLAMRLAEQSAPDYPDGVWVCQLAGIREEALAVEAVATVLEVQRRQGHSILQGLVEVLQSRQLLVVFDNCEHLLDPVAEIADSILTACPRVRVITTSREPLGIDGEVVRPVGPLPLPREGETDPVMALESPAVRLFVALATAAHPDFRLTDATTQPVSDICRRLDGLPLALELAAARARSMAPGDLADRLHEGLEVLASSPRRAPRHQTLHSTVGWSYDLLGHSEQVLFDRLSVFAGRFTVDDVQDICSDGSVPAGAVTNTLAALVDKSMIIADTTRRPTRYVLLETLRAFGRDQLREGATAELGRRHAARIIQQVELAGTGMDGPDEATWVQRLDDQFDDLRVAHRWALTHDDLDGALQLVVGLREFAFRGMRYELFSWAEATLAMTGVDRHVLAPLAFATAAYGRFVRGDLDHAMALAEQSIRIEERLDLPPCGLHWRTMGNVLYYRGHAGAAADICERMVSAARTSGSDARLVHALYMTSVGLASEARTESSRRLADEAVGIAARTGNPSARASARYAQAITVGTGDPDRAAAILGEAVAHGLDGDNRWIVAFARTELVSLASRRGDLDSALMTARDVIDTWYRAGDWANQWLTLRHVASLLAQCGELHHAALLHAAVRVASAELAMPIEAADRRRIAVILARLPVDLGPAGFAAAEAEAAYMSANDVVHATQDVIGRVLAAR